MCKVTDQSFCTPGLQHMRKATSQAHHKEGQQLWALPHMLGHTTTAHKAMHAQP